MILSVLDKIKTGEMTINMPKEYENVPYHTTARLDDEFSMMKIDEDENTEADILLTGFILSVIVFVST